MNRTLIVVAVVIVGLGLAGAAFFLKKSPSANPQSVQNTDIQSSDIPAESVSPNSINSENALPEAVSQPKNGTQTPQAGADQAGAKKEAATLINQMNASAGEFNAMNDSAGQMDQNTSL